MRQLCVSLLALLASTLGFAQITPESTTLLKSSPSSSENNYSSGRYKVIPISKSKEAPREPRLRNEAEEEKEPVAEPLSTTTPTNEVTESLKTPATTVPEPAPTQLPEPVVYKIESLRTDPRANVLSLWIAPGYQYRSASSNYWYRKYDASSPIASLGGSIWITPTFGLDVAYSSTFGADISRNTTTNEKVSADFRTLNAAFKYRKFFGESKKSPAYSIGLSSYESEMIVPKSETDRARIKTSGLGLVMDLSMPSSVGHRWDWGLEYNPDLRAKEKGSALGLRSGKLDKGQGLALEVKSVYQLDSRNSAFWRLGHRVNKFIYRGESTPNDPIRGTSISGVSVTESIITLDFGFLWGE